MIWCAECATYRSDPCPVCNLRRRIERAQEANLKAYRALPWEARIQRREGEATEKEMKGDPYPIKGSDSDKEAWLVKDLNRELERIKKDTSRMRKVIRDANGR